MSRVKTTMSAPEGVEESIIAGTYYWPDENGEISTTNAEHRAVLIQHGYSVVGEVSVMRPAAALGAIDHDEMGRGQLFAALQERGLSFPETATRNELAEIAEGWNVARRRGRQGLAAASPAQAASPAAATQTPADRQPAATAAAGASGEVDFGEATYEELKGWLTARGIGFPGNTPKKALRDMAEKAHAAQISARANAAAA